MLQAIKNKKAGRNFNGTEVHWNALFSGSEDSLTSSVIGTLIYLPSFLLWEILNKALGKHVFGENEVIKDVSFWPLWNSEYTGNITFVEPDVFIRTSTKDIIIETKKYDGTGQERNQWKRELLAYQNEYFEDKKKVVFIALGGNKEDSSISIDISSFTCDELPEGYRRHFTVFRLHWRILLNTCLEYQKKMRLNSTIENNCYLRILNDVVDYFEVHHFKTVKLFGDTKYLENQIISFKAKGHILNMPSNDSFQSTYPTFFVKLKKENIQLYNQSELKLLNYDSK